MKYRRCPGGGQVLRWRQPLFAHHPDMNEVMAELRPKFAAIPGIIVFMQNPPPIQIGGQLTKSQYQFTLQSPDTEELYRAATHFERKMARCRDCRT